MLDLPSVVYTDQPYSLPTYYSFGTHGTGTVECKDENNNLVTTTEYMTGGQHTVTCNLTAKDGTKAGPISRTFTVEVRPYGPLINLNKVPKKIVRGDSYALPSAYSYGTHGTGNYQVEINGNLVSNTNTLELGTYEINGTITAADGTVSYATKTIQVVEGFEPYVDLDSIPTRIYLGDSYSLPASYNYGRPNSGTLTCKDADGFEYYNTASLSLGTHTITCNIKNDAGLTDTATKTIKVEKRPVKPIYPEAPTITVDPTGLVDETTVTITPIDTASKIYYRIEGGSWIEYTAPFIVRDNVRIDAYYIRQTDGLDSKTGTYYVSNIKEPNLPSVRILANPGYLSPDNEKVTITLECTDCDYMEYSFDGVIYNRYNNAFDVTESKTIWARGHNANGYSKPIKRTIVTKTPGIPAVDNIDISITLDPSKKTQGKTLNKVKVTIVYGKNADKKYYSLDGGNTYLEYTEPFYVTKNMTIWAYATGTNAKGGPIRKDINFLSEGMPQPDIIASPEAPNRAYQVLVTINYDDIATVRRYKIVHADGTEDNWQDYTGPFWIDENNVKIVAYQEDDNGYNNQNELEISNIIPVPVYTPADKGDYYLITLNYPSTSSEEAREYKWKNDGTWKKYNNHGILLIKPEEKDKYFKPGVDGIEVEDSNGNMVQIDMNHVYLMDVSWAELSQNLFMRWDLTKPKTPTIYVDNEDDPVREVTVTIKYSNRIIDRYYKIVKTDGTETEWLKYTGPFKVTDNNTIIKAKGLNSTEVESLVAEKLISNIDKQAPTIDVKGDLTTPKQKTNLTVTATDDIMMYMVKYAKGQHNADYFNENKEDEGTSFRNGSAIVISENGIYTIYAVDQAGNETLREVEVTNIDKTAPNMSVSIKSVTYLQAKIDIDYGDSATKEYKVGTNGTWETYNGTITINAANVHSLKNTDGTITVYARGKDAANNTQTVSEVIYGMDLDMPATPTITSTTAYPTITEYGVKIKSNVTTTFDNRNDITNYISTDGGSTWNVYTGNEEFNGGTIKVKSVKNDTGLTTPIASTTIKAANDALEENAYDGDNTTYVDSRNRKLYISPEMRGKQMFVKANDLYVHIYFYDANGNRINNDTINSGGNRFDGNYKISSTATYLMSDSNHLFEIAVYTTPTITGSQTYPILTEYGVTPGYDNVTISYFQTAVTKQYKIDSGSWQNYTGAIKLSEGQVVTTRSVDKYGKVLGSQTYTGKIPTDGLAKEAYDNNNSTAAPLTGRLNISAEMRGKKLYASSDSLSGNFNFYDSGNNSLAAYGGSTGNFKTGPFDIPATATYMKFGAGTYSGKLKEIRPYNDPVINGSKGYPTITRSGITPGSSNVTITYFQTAVTKQYKIDNGSWQTYTGAVNVLAGKTIYARSLDKNNKASATSNYQVVLADDALAADAYDGNNSTCAAAGRINVNQDVWGQKIYIKSNTLYMAVYQYDSSDQIIDTIRAKGNALNGEYTIVSNTKYLKFASTGYGVTSCEIQYRGTRNATTSSTNSLQSTPRLSSAQLRTVETVTTATAVSSSIDSPNIKAIINQDESRTIMIEYTPGYTNQYSTDLGETWTEYTESFKVTDNVIIIARHLDGEKVVSASTYTITAIPSKIEEPTENKEEPVETKPTETQNNQEETTPVVPSTDTTENNEEGEENE